LRTVYNAVCGWNQRLAGGTRRPKEPRMIRHTVVFRLKHPRGSAEEAGFLAAARRLADVPGVEHFEVLRQVGAKNDYHFGLSMEFWDDRAYKAYDAHPDHVAFVRDRWLREVDAFLEIDYVRM
jgi:heme-degrading monooxygenase HmoA